MIKPASNRNQIAQAAAKTKVFIWFIAAVALSFIARYSDYIPLTLGILVVTPVALALAALVNRFILNPSSGLYVMNPGFAFGILILSVASWLTAKSRFHLMNYHQYWLPFGIIALCMWILLMLPQFKGLRVMFKVNLLFTFFMAVFYSAGGTILINCLPDDSYPMKFNTEVESKSITHSKGPHYHLTLVPWQRGQQPVEIEVNEAEYSQTPVDGPVGVHIKSGLLHIPWFYIDLGE